jgi:hypothetical protein
MKVAIIDTDNSLRVSNSDDVANRSASRSLPGRARE